MKPLPSPRVISIDTETYGACERDLAGRRLPRQTVFHPRRSIHVDRCLPSQLVQSVQITVPEEDPRLWSAAPGGWTVPLVAGLRPGRTFILYPSRRDHMRTLLRWLAHADTLIGMNLPFDIQYLRTLPGVSPSLEWRSKTLIDLAVINYLDSEVRPERSLKDLGPLFGAFRYERTIGERRFPSPKSLDFLAYAASDPHNTLLMAAALAHQIRTVQPHSAKNGRHILPHYSNNLWCVIQMAESGIPYSISRLSSLRDRLLESVRSCEEACRERGLLLQGEGSDASKRAFASSLVPKVQPLLGPEEQITITAKTKEIQWTDSNRALFLKYLPEGDPARPLLELASTHSKSQKTLSTWVWPLLHSRRNRPDERTSVLVPCPDGPPLVGIAHPSFYVTPGPVKGGSGAEGGTIQGRITLKNPSAQTDPPEVEACRRSRYPGGTLISFDLKQIELRVPAILSGEPTLVSSFVDGIDLHSDRAVRMFGEAIRSAPKFKSVYRQAGKTVNFADAFWASAARMQASVFEMTGVLLPLSFFEAAVRDRPIVRPVLYRWQVNLIESVRSARRIDLPLIGLSRSFRGPLNDHLNEILNFPVQTWAALIMHDLHDAVLRRLPSRCKAFLQTYDSASFDSHPSSSDDLLRCFDDALAWEQSEGLWHRFCVEYGTRVPLEIEVKETA